MTYIVKFYDKERNLLSEATYTGSKAAVVAFKNVYSKQLKNVDLVVIEPKGKK